MTSPGYAHFSGLCEEFLAQRIGQNKQSKEFRDERDIAPSKRKSWKNVINISRQRKEDTVSME